MTKQDAYDQAISKVCTDEHFMSTFKFYPVEKLRNNGYFRKCNEQIFVNYFCEVCNFELDLTCDDVNRAVEDIFTYARAAKLYAY